MKEKIRQAIKDLLDEEKPNEFCDCGTKLNWFEQSCLGQCYKCFQEEEDAEEDAYGRSQKDLCYGCHRDWEPSDTCGFCLEAKQEDNYILENFYDFSEKKEEVLPADDEIPF